MRTAWTDRDGAWSDILADRDVVAGVDDAEPRRVVVVVQHLHCHLQPAVRAYFNVPTGTDVLGDLKSVLEGLVTRA